MADDLKEYGYLWDGMTEISKEDAEKLYTTKEIFLLYPDDTEAAVTSFDEIGRHYKLGGKFGVER